MIIFLLIYIIIIISFRMVFMKITLVIRIVLFDGVLYRMVHTEDVLKHNIVECRIRLLLKRIFWNNLQNFMG
jgi:hypothetical protein